MTVIDKIKEVQMRAHVFQHVPFEGIGSIDPWLRNRRANVTYTRFFEKALLPELGALDLLVVMGGSMSVNDERDFPWLRAEKEFICSAIRTEIPILGICLGAQLLAAALGTRVYRNHQKEIGWHSVAAAFSGADAFHFPDRFTAFHWHGETFDLPPGARLLARSLACKNQAFQIGRRIVGLQFHLESTPESVGALIDNCRDELIAGPHIQTEDELRHVQRSAYDGINAIMEELLSYISGQP